ncbi:MULTISPECIES: trimeric intracellular cation channel family protein [unclassified Motilimonas]|uniref:trimeric intracellular cation channel family protein n=1 Tax=Motilimonas TaxID=1914248 RepID=UPI001E38EE3F|nr:MULTISPECIES: trimeric intracellular cation channel family protein [unclassified Motilimonas]MDO6525526.1 trimeric intracellular cation channel family protein [Motilimonas sp. 1_MG-2023]
MLYFFGLLAVFVFSATGVLAASKKRVDLVSVLLTGMITALGGGTLRDLLIGQPVFWLVDETYLWVALLGSLVTFLSEPSMRKRYHWVLYLDGLGIALFAVQAIDKVQGVGYSAVVAVLMSVITAIMGGVMRDVMTGHTTLLSTKELYATPVLVGSICYVILKETSLPPGLPAAIGFFVVAVFRFIAIRFNISYPERFMIGPR